MLKKKNTNIVSSVVSVHGISLSSLAIVLTNFIVACSKYNNINISSVDICSFDFLILIVLLALNSIDALNEHKEFTSGCIKIERIVSGISFVLSLIVICIVAGAWINFWSITDCSLTFNGRLANIHRITKVKMFDLSFVIDFYFVSSVMQLIASLFKFKIDKDIKKEIVG